MSLPKSRCCPVLFSRSTPLACLMTHIVAVRMDLNDVGYQTHKNMYQTCIPIGLLDFLPIARVDLQYQCGACCSEQLNRICTWQASHAQAYSQVRLMTPVWAATNNTNNNLGSFSWLIKTWDNFVHFCMPTGTHFFNIPPYIPDLPAPFPARAVLRIWYAPEAKIYDTGNPTQCQEIQLFLTHSFSKLKVNWGIYSSVCN